ncbi:MAG: family N-acetyltransferase [Clostridia bacterium]|jgi:predicted N-acetyltransferase YhbS|nr:family N-acetyltransferase [Clostridia bacterium]
MLIRKETKEDYDQIREVIKSAFKAIEENDDEFNEWTLAERIRKSEYYINDLSLVAEIDGIVVGHIMFTPLKIKGSAETHESLDLAPVSVRTDYQNQGIGKLLVRSGIEKAKELGYKSLIVMGHPKYYQSFGFKLASDWKIGLDNEYNSKYLFALELVDGGLDGVSGIVEYCPPFYNENGELI